MSRSLRLTVGAATIAVALAAAILPPAGAAPPGGSLRGLLLTGSDTCGFKTVYVAPQAPYLFAPVRLLGEDFSATGDLLRPYQVTIVTGEGLKARHLAPGETYTAPGRPPKDPVTCSFAGATKEEGEFEIMISGTIRG